jgi:spore germination cell wall hydrolase CwlJ-like protein
MSSKVQKASIVAVAATMIAALASAQGSGAVAQDHTPIATQSEPDTVFVSEPIVQPQPASPAPQDLPEPEDVQTSSASSLASLVSTQDNGQGLSDELRCLAGAVYFEAKGESLAGQLAVGRVVVARSKSGRFPASYCGVVYQPAQFSFIRGRAMPGINTGSQDWREAVAIARISDSGSWRSPVEGALFFHAARVSPNWRLTRMARVENHVFYR